MSQARFDPAADFSPGGPACSPSALPLSVSIFADRAHLRAEIGQDAAAAGFRVAASADLAALLDEQPLVLGDIILVDCDQRKLEVELSDAELADRLSKVKRPAPRYKTGVFAKYAASVSSAARGAVTVPKW